MFLPFFRVRVMLSSVLPRCQNRFNDGRRLPPSTLVTNNRIAKETNDGLLLAAAGTSRLSVAGRDRFLVNDCPVRHLLSLDGLHLSRKDPRIIVEDIESSVYFVRLIQRTLSA